jgi:hypothetical protein
MDTFECLETMTKRNRVKMSALMHGRALQQSSQCAEVAPLTNYTTTHLNVSWKRWIGISNTMQSKKIDLHNLSPKSPQECKRLHNHNQLKHQHNNNTIFP